MNNIKEKKYILFDLDGTITDSMEGITKSVQYALSKFEINVDNLNELCKFIGPPLKDSFMKYYNFSEKEAERAIEFYREYFEKNGIYENLVYDNIEEIFKSLKEQGKYLLIATTKPTFFAEKILAYFNLSHYFELVSGSNMDGTREKKDEVIEFALKEKNITDYSKVIMIGDREHDVIGAKKLGIESIGVLYGYGDYNELSSSGADYIVKDVQELKELLCK